MKKAAKRGVVAVLVMAALAGAFLWRKRWITARGWRSWPSKRS